MQTGQLDRHPGQAAERRVLVAVIAECEDDRAALSSAFAVKGAQRVICSSTLDAAGELIEKAHVDAIIGFVDEQASWQRFRALAERFPDLLSVLLVSDPDRLDATNGDGRVLNAVVGISREDLATRAAAATAEAVDGLPMPSTPVTTADASDRQKLTALSEREQEVLMHTARGMAIKEIARHIGRSYGTVATHRAKIMEKLGLHDKVALTRFAIRMGLIEA